MNIILVEDMVCVIYDKLLPRLHHMYSTPLCSKGNIQLKFLIFLALFLEYTRCIVACVCFFFFQNIDFLPQGENLSPKNVMALCFY